MIIFAAGYAFDYARSCRYADVLRYYGLRWLRYDYGCLATMLTRAQLPPCLLPPGRLSQYRAARYAHFHLRCYYDAGAKYRAMQCARLRHAIVYRRRHA